MSYGSGMPTEPHDFYTDFASLNVAEAGMTLILLRSLPEPRFARGAAQKGDDPDVEGTPVEGEPTPPDAMSMEIVARVRFTPAFGIALRDLLTRSLINAGVETAPAQDAAPSGGEGAVASEKSTP